jgi:hypothetical protein
VRVPLTAEKKAVAVAKRAATRAARDDGEKEEEGRQGFRESGARRDASRWIEPRRQAVRVTGQRARRRQRRHDTARVLDVRGSRPDNQGSGGAAHKRAALPRPATGALLTSAPPCSEQRGRL